MRVPHVHPPRRTGSARPGISQRLPGQGASDDESGPAQVAAAPPKRFAGGGYWEAMKGDMTGWFEVGVDGPRRHHYRLFCRLDAMRRKPGTEPASA